MAKTLGKFLSEIEEKNAGSNPPVLNNFFRFAHLGKNIGVLYATGAYSDNVVAYFIKANGIRFTLTELLVSDTYVLEKLPLVLDVPGERYGQRKEIDPGDKDHKPILKMFIDVGFPVISSSEQRGDFETF